MDTVRAVNKRARCAPVRYCEEDEHEAQEEEPVVVQAPTPFRRCSNSRDGYHTNTKSPSSGKGGHTAVTLTLQDRDVLDCCVCFEPLKAPIFQCESGHIICSSCCLRMKDKCPTCQSPFSSNRCRAMERILESLRVSCDNAKYGCKESYVYFQKSEHESTCRYAPCSCPFPGCRYINSAKSLYKHWSTKHKSLNHGFATGSNIAMSLEKTDQFFVLQEKEEGTLFVVNISPEFRGCIVSVSCIAPQNGVGEYSYILSAATEDERHKLSLESKAAVVQSTGDDLFSKDFLVVPYEFFACSSGEKVQMVVRIVHN